MKFAINILVLFIFSFSAQCNIVYASKYIDERPVSIHRKGGFPYNNIEKIKEYKVWAVIADISKKNPKNFNKTSYYKLSNLRIENIFISQDSTPLSSFVFKIDGFEFKLDEVDYVRTVAGTVNYGYSLGDLYYPALRIHFKDDTIMKVDMSKDTSLYSLSNHEYRVFNVYKKSIAGKSKIEVSNNNLSDNQVLFGFSATKEGAKRLFDVFDYNYTKITNIKAGDSAIIKTKDGDVKIEAERVRENFTSKRKVGREYWSNKPIYEEYADYKDHYYFSVDGNKFNVDKFDNSFFRINYNNVIYLYNGNMYGNYAVGYITKEKAVENGYFKFNDRLEVSRSSGVSR